jgi:hypothetical protein
LGCPKGFLLLAISERDFNPGNPFLTEERVTATMGISNWIFSLLRIALPIGFGLFLMVLFQMLRRERE